MGEHKVTGKKQDEMSGSSFGSPISVREQALDDDTQAVLEWLGILRDGQLMVDHRVLNRPVVDPDHDYVDLVHRLVREKGRKLPGFVRDALGRLADKYEWLRELMNQPVDRVREARTIAHELETQELVIGALLQYAQTAHLEKRSGALRPGEFEERTESWIMAILRQREHDAFVRTGQIGTGHYREEDGIFTFVRIPNFARAYQKLMVDYPSDPEATSAEVMESMGLVRAFAAILPYRSSDRPEDIIYHTEGMDLVSAERAFETARAYMPRIPVLDISPIFTGVNLSFADVMRAALAIADGGQYWTGDTVAGSILTMCRKTGTGMVDFAEIRDQTRFCEELFLRDPGALNRISEHLKLGVVNHEQVVEIIREGQADGLILSPETRFQLLEYVMLTFHLLHGIDRQQVLRKLQRARGKGGSTQAERDFYQELFCLDYAAYLVGATIPTPPSSDKVQGFFDDQEARLIEDSMEAVEWIAFELAKADAEVAGRKARAEATSCVADPGPIAISGSSSEDGSDDVSPSQMERLFEQDSGFSEEKVIDQGSGEYSQLAGTVSVSAEADISGGISDESESSSGSGSDGSNGPPIHPSSSDVVGGDDPEALAGESEPTWDTTQPPPRCSARPIISGEIAQIPLDARMSHLEQLEAERVTIQEAESEEFDTAPPVHLDSSDVLVDSEATPRLPSGSRKVLVPDDSLSELSEVGTPSRERRVIAVGEPFTPSGIGSNGSAPADQSPPEGGNGLIQSAASAKAPEGYVDPSGELVVDGEPDTAEVRGGISADPGPSWGTLDSNDEQVTRSDQPSESKEFAAMTTEGMPAVEMRAIAPGELKDDATEKDLRGPKKS